MSNLTAWQLLATLIAEEQSRETLECIRRLVSPTAAELFRDWQVLQMRELLRVNRTARSGGADSHSTRIADSSSSSAAWLAACEACKPPAGFAGLQDGAHRVWKQEERAALLSQYEALCKAGGKAAAALAVLHERWGYARPKSDAGGSLSKVLTRARAERKARQQGRVIRAIA